MSLSTIGSIATHIAENFVLPVGVSGNLVEIVDMQRVYVQNYTRNSIGSNSIDETYQNAILNFSTAQTLDKAFSWAASIGVSGAANIAISGAQNLDQVSLGDLSLNVDAKAEVAALNAINSYSREAPVQFRQMAIEDLKNIGRKVQIVRVLS